jgi:hypothetical protein
MSTTTKSWTRGAAGNIRSSASLAASGTANYDVDCSGAVGATVHVKNTPGGTVAATRGVRVEVFRRFGNSPTTADTAVQPFTLPSAVASTAESLDVDLAGDYYNIKITNLDTANAVTVEITGDSFVLSTT